MYLKNLFKVKSLDFIIKIGHIKEGMTLYL